MNLLFWLPIGRVPEMDALSLSTLLRDGDRPQLIDVRTTLEYRRGHVAGALSAPIGALSAALPDLPIDKARPVVAICATAHRSIPAVRLLRRAGFDARQLKGGMIAWYRYRLPTTTEEP
jgi:rhodanese-related sulfurtransferase